MTLQVQQNLKCLTSTRTTASPLSPGDHVFQDGPIDGLIVQPLKRFSDTRGWLTEVFRSDELPSAIHPTMAYVSQTQPGVVRGPHEHREQTDFFVFLGPGDFEIFLWDARPMSPTLGNRQILLAGQSNPRLIVVPPGVVHAYRNISTFPAWVLNAPNRLYAGPGRREPIDEIRHENDPYSPYQVDNLQIQLDEDQDDLG